MKALLLALAWATSAAAQDRCIIACDVTTTGAEAAVRLATHLGRPLPVGVATVGLVEGGFQDAFIQARMQVTRAELPLLLHDLAIAPENLARSAGEDFGPSGPGWWDVEAQDGLLVGYGDLDAFAWSLVGVARSDEGATVYLWAFQT